MPDIPCFYKLYKEIVHYMNIYDRTVKNYPYPLYRPKKQYLSKSLKILKNIILFYVASSNLNYLTLNCTFSLIISRESE